MLISGKQNLEGGWSYMKTYPAHIWKEENNTYSVEFLIFLDALLQVKP